MEKELEKIILKAQENEITEHLVYSKLAKLSKDKKRNEILTRLSKEELSHYIFWRNYTKKDVKPNMIKVWFYSLISKIFGLTFTLKLMESGEVEAVNIYEKVSSKIPVVKKIIKDEDKHEKLLIDLINEEFLDYIGSIVLGLNDALVELTGALAGLTFALQESKIVAFSVLITGLAASLSMAASEYLSAKVEKGKNPIKSSLYTGIAYILTVLVLLLPYFVFKNIFVSFAFTIFNAVLIIFVFNFYVSVAKNLNFKKRFLEMLLVSFGVAFISFLAGLLLKSFL